MSNRISKIAIFKGRKIRKIWIGDAWWFSVIDVVAALTLSDNPRDYWYKMKIREKDDAGVELSTVCRQLKLTAPDGKKRETDCADTEGVFRIIQSIPSKKAEPFKRWLAKVGKERIDEIENPELGMLRTKDRDSLGFPRLRCDAKDGGDVAGRTRKDIESRTGTKIVSRENYLPHNKKKELGK